MHGVCCVPEWIKSFIVEMHDWLAFVFKLIKKMYIVTKIVLTKENS